MADDEFGYCQTDLGASRYYQLDYFRSECIEYVDPTPAPTNAFQTAPCGLLMVKTNQRKGHLELIFIYVYDTYRLLYLFCI